MLSALKTASKVNKALAINSASPRKRYYAIKEALMYVDGKEVTAEITDGEGADTSAAAVSEEAGYGGFVLELDEVNGTVKSIEWADMSGAHEPIVFVRG